MSFNLTYLFAGPRKYRRRRLTAEEQLIVDLLRGYDTDARAVINTKSTVTVSIQFLLLRIQRLVSLAASFFIFQCTSILIQQLMMS